MKYITQLKTIVDSCPAALFQYTLMEEGHVQVPIFTFLSSSIELVWPGISRSEIIHRPEVLLNNLSPDNADVVRDTFRTCVRLRKPLNIKFYFHDRDGKRIWLSATAQPVEDEYGQVFLNGVFQDITQTENKEREFMESLMISQQQYHSMVDEVEDYVILLLDKNGNVVNWNKGAAKLKGYGKDEIIGKNMELFYREIDRIGKKPVLLLEQARLTGKSTDEGWRKKKDGSLFWAYVVITALHDQSGNLIGFTKVTRDMTRDREHLNAIEAQNKILRSIAYTQSHLVRAPLSRIMGLCNLINDYELSEAELKDLLKAMKYSCSELDELITDITNKSNSIESGLQP